MKKSSKCYKYCFILRGGTEACSLPQTLLQGSWRATETHVQGLKNMPALALV